MRAHFMIPALCSSLMLYSIGPTKAGPLPPGQRTGAMFFVGGGAAFVSNPRGSELGDVDPRLGLAAGVLVTSPEPGAVAFDLGLILERRGAVTRVNWQSWLPGSKAIGIEREFALTQLTVPLRARLDLAQGGNRPYVTFGPELSILLRARSELTVIEEGHRRSAGGDDVTRWANRFIWGTYTGVGTTRRLGRKEAFLELGLSLGLEGVGGDSGAKDAPASGLGEAKTRMLLLSGGIQL
jgi:hypothetical protein